MRAIYCGIGVCSLVAAVACEPSQPEVQAMRCEADPTVEARIADAQEIHVAAHLRADAEGAAAIYTDDVWFQLDGGAELRSRETVIAAYEDAYSTLRYMDIVYTDVETTVCGDAAHAVGHYSETFELEYRA